MNKKPKFHKVYINPALGYWEDKNKPIEFNQLPNDYCPIVLPHGDYPTQQAIDEAMNIIKGMTVTIDRTDHFCIGKRCLICETRNLVNPFEV